MKKLIAQLFTLLCFSSYGQKLSSSTYKNVDSVHTYSNAEVVTYKDKFGKTKSDTLYYNKMNKDIKIEFVEDMTIDEEIKLKRK